MVRPLRKEGLRAQQPYETFMSGWILGDCGHQWWSKTTVSASITRRLCPQCNQHVRVKETGSGRICKCGTLLNRYNRGHLCATCEKRESLPK